jgi:hypothetical protein
MVVKMIPTPAQIFAQLERGEIEREEMQALMALHARELIAEMEEDYLNPAAALMEQLLARRQSSKLARKHGGRLLREVLYALSEAEDFPPAKYLWNALHPDVPLHCFFRIKRVPVFRILAIEWEAGTVKVETRYGAVEKGKAQQRSFALRRGRWGVLQVVEE